MYLKRGPPAPDSAASHHNPTSSHLTESREGNGMGENVVKSKEREMYYVMSSLGRWPPTTIGPTMFLIYHRSLIMSKSPRLKKSKI